MIYTALIGNPTGHSVSHVMYENLAKSIGLSSDYRHLKIDVSSEDLAKTVDACRQLKFRGINITIPYKIDIIPLLDSIDTTAQKVGAVNTVTFTKQLKGYNTDWYGIYEPVRRRIKRPIDEAIIFGSGGAARAAIYACKQLNISTIHVLHRSSSDDSTTKQLLSERERLGIQMHPYSELRKLVKSSGLIVNATSTGMVGQAISPFPLNDLDNIPMNGKVYFEVVFNPLETPLLKYFQKNGASTIDGLWMMIFQGIESLSIWLDQQITLTPKQFTELHTLLRNELIHA